MIRVLIEIHPWDGGEPREIAALEVWNKTEIGDVCDYGFELRNDAGQVVRGEVHGHERSIGWAPLVERALHMAWVCLPLAPLPQSGPVAPKPSDSEP